MELPSGNQQTSTNTIAYQTHEKKNLGRGRSPLTHKQLYKPFLDFDYNNSPDYIKSLKNVFGENFIAEATKNDPQSKSLYQFIEKRDWDK